MARREIERLDRAAVEAATVPGLHADGDGLYLHVGDNGSKSWILRYRLDGKRRDMGLGRYPLFSLKDARARANAQRRLLADRIDPLPVNGRRRSKPATTQGVAAGITFEQVAELTITAKRSAWGPKQEKDWRQSLRDHVFPAIGNKPVAGLGVDDVEAVLKPIWSAKPVTAKRLRQRMEAVLDYATAKKYREGENPARHKGNLEHLLAADAKGEQNHHQALPYTDMLGFMATLPDTLAAKALAFCILTAARRGEVRQATWAEIDLEGRTWTVPAGHMKARKEHKVPLSDAAVTLLRDLPRTGERVFPIGASEMLRVTTKVRPGIAVHGFRSTFRTWAQDTTDFPRETVEHCLAHIEGSASELAYKRGDALEKRRQVMQAWADYCCPQW